LHSLLDGWSWKGRYVSPCIFMYAVHLILFPTCLYIRRFRRLAFVATSIVRRYCVKKLPLQFFPRVSAMGGSPLTSTLAPALAPTSTTTSLLPTMSFAPCGPLYHCSGLAMVTDLLPYVLEYWCQFLYHILPVFHKVLLCEHVEILSACHEMSMGLGSPLLLGFPFFFCMNLLA